MRQPVVDIGGRGGEVVGVEGTSSVGVVVVVVRLYVEGTPLVVVVVVPLYVEGTSVVVVEGFVVGPWNVKGTSSSKVGRRGLAQRREEERKHEELGSSCGRLWGPGSTAAWRPAQVPESKNPDARRCQVATTQGPGDRRSGDWRTDRGVRDVRCTDPGRDDRNYLGGTACEAQAAGDVHNPAACGQSLRNENTGLNLWPGGRWKDGCRSGVVASELAKWRPDGEATLLKRHQRQW